MKTALFSTSSFEKPYFDRLNSGRHELTYLDARLDPETAYLAKGFDAVCVFVHDDVSLATIQQLSGSGVRLIALRCAGYNNVDVKAANAANIKVVRVPAYAPQAIAEHAVALIMALNRKTHKAYNRVRENNFLPDNLMGFNLYGKTVGVIGMGRIGAAFSRIMLGFGCNVIAYDIQQPADKPEAVTYRSFEEVIQLSDIISIHCPLTPETHYLFSEDVFAKMKKGCMLINTARGGVINTIDAIASLKSGQLGYLGLDVYEGEESLFFRDLSATVVQDDILERLLSFNNVLVTPHHAFFTHEAMEEITGTTLENLTIFETGKTLINEV